MTKQEILAFADEHGLSLTEAARRLQMQEVQRGIVDDKAGGGNFRGDGIWLAPMAASNSPRFYEVSIFDRAAERVVAAQFERNKMAATHRQELLAQEKEKANFCPTRRISARFFVEYVEQTEQRIAALESEIQALKAELQAISK